MASPPGLAPVARPRRNHVSGSQDSAVSAALRNGNGEPAQARRTPADINATTRPAKGTTAAVVHVWATPHLILGTRGRLRLVLIVERCSFRCGRSHVHSGGVDFTAGRRKAGCGRGSYVVHALTPVELSRYDVDGTADDEPELVGCMCVAVLRPTLRRIK